MEIINFLNKRLSDEELNGLLTELMGFCIDKTYKNLRILDEEGDSIDLEKMIGETDIHIVRNVLYLMETVAEERGVSKGENNIRREFRKLLNL